MYIDKVISYKKAWEIVNNNHRVELSEIQSALDDLFSENIELGIQTGRMHSRDYWDSLMYKKKWELIDRTHYTADGNRINVSRLGPIKNGLSVSLPIGSFDTLSRWIFQQTTVAIKYELIKTPIMLVPVRDFARGSTNILLRRENFEMILSQLEMLSPLSHQYPFLIIGYSNNKSASAPEIIEIPSDLYVKEEKSVIDRCIEFPPEYHQAGLDILNYFGTYLREQYPEENASVKIEQKGLTVRLVIETADGKSEVIEKALHEYELIITGVEPPEKFSSNDKLILELRNELRIAKYRLESQQDIIGVQNNRIEKLLDIVGNGLSQQHHVMVDFKPTITLSNSITINQEVASALSCVTELMEELPESNDAYFALKELEGSLISIESDNNKDSVRRSPAMSKFKRLIDRATDTGNSLNTAIKKAEKGWEIFSDLATRYNKLAEWCGLPVVPSILMK